MQCIGGLYAKSRKVADVHEKPTFSDKILKDVNLFFCSNLQGHWTTYHKEALPTVVFKAQYLLSS